MVISWIDHHQGHSQEPNVSVLEREEQIWFMYMAMVIGTSYWFVTIGWWRRVLGSWVYIKVLGEEGGWGLLVSLGLVGTHFGEMAHGSYFSIDIVKSYPFIAVTWDPLTDMKTFSHVLEDTFSCNDTKNSYFFSPWCIQCARLESAILHMTCIKCNIRETHFPHGLT